MLKIIIRVLIILAVFAAVAGGIYLLVQKSGASLLADSQVEGGFHGGNGPRQEGNRINEGQSSTDGQRPSGGDFDRHGESGTFSLAELGESIGKVALITIGVVLIQGLIRFFRRRKNSTQLSAS